MIVARALKAQHLVIAGIATGVSISHTTSTSDYPPAARAAVAHAEVAEISKQVMLYALDSGSRLLPPGFSLNDLTQGASPYVKPKDLIDPWGRPYWITTDPAGTSWIVSLGADGMVGGIGEAADVASPPFDVTGTRSW